MIQNWYFDCVTSPIASLISVRFAEHAKTSRLGLWIPLRRMRGLKEDHFRKNNKEPRGKVNRTTMSVPCKPSKSAVHRLGFRIRLQTSGNDGGLRFLAMVLCRTMQPARGEWALCRKPALPGHFKVFKNVMQRRDITGLSPNNSFSTAASP